MILFNASTLSFETTGAAGGGLGLVGAGLVLIKKNVMVAGVAFFVNRLSFQNVTKCYKSSTPYSFASNRFIPSDYLF